MSTIKDGGPAFPAIYGGCNAPPVATAYATGPSTFSSSGMSLRDWFAGQFLAGFFANPDAPRFLRESALEGEKFGQTASRLAYDYAGSMLKAREASDA